MAKYCLHPARLKIFTIDKENQKGVWAFRYYSYEDLIRFYGLDEKDCVKYDPREKTDEDLIHLFPDKEGKWKLPKD